MGSAPSAMLSPETMKALETLPEAAQAELKAFAAKHGAAEKAAPEAPPPGAQASQQPLKDVQADSSRTCVARVQACLDSIAAKDGELNCCVEVLAESALKQAADADAKLAGGAARRVLEGVPIVVKVNIDVAGTLSTNSMPGLADWRPETTAPVVTKLVEAGAIVVAKSNMPEAAVGAWGFSPVHGLTKNATNPKYTTSGSSSGTASAIAASIVPCGLGSDTGGSLRMPAECCGIAGMRPSRDRYPIDGIVPCNVGHDTAGPMAASVADIAVLDAVLTGEPLASYDAADLSGVAFGVPADLWKDAAAGHKAALELAVAALTKAGAACKRDVADFKPLGEFKYERHLDFRQAGITAYLDATKKYDFDGVRPRSPSTRAPTQFAHGPPALQIFSPNFLSTCSLHMFSLSRSALATRDVAPAPRARPPGARQILLPGVQTLLHRPHRHEEGASRERHQTARRRGGGGEGDVRGGARRAREARRQVLRRPQGRLCAHAAHARRAAAGPQPR